MFAPIVASTGDHRARSLDEAARGREFRRMEPTEPFQAVAVAVRLLGALHPDRVARSPTAVTCAINEPDTVPACSNPTSSRTRRRLPTTRSSSTR